MKNKKNNTFLANKSDKWLNNTKVSKVKNEIKIKYI